MQVLWIPNNKVFQIPFCGFLEHFTYPYAILLSTLLQLLPSVNSYILDQLRIKKSFYFTLFDSLSIPFCLQEDNEAVKQLKVFL